MRYYLKENTLFIRGNFFAVSSGVQGGIHEVSTLFNHTVSSGFSDPDKEIEFIARRNGVTPNSSFGLFTAVPMDRLCIVKYDEIHLFCTAGVTHPDTEILDINSADLAPGTINIIVYIDTGCSDQALIDGVITTTEAKAYALMSKGYQSAGTVTDAVIVAARERGAVQYLGSATGLGQKVHASAVLGVTKALEQYEADVTRMNPSFFIWSRIGTPRWVSWESGNCQYYPCHFPGQRCDYCYCPLYPCGDELLGVWIDKSDNSRIWNCASCTLNHQPEVARYLKRNPEASLFELKCILKNANS